MGEGGAVNIISKVHLKLAKSLEIGVAIVGVIAVKTIVVAKDLSGL